MNLNQTNSKLNSIFRNNLKRLMEYAGFNNSNFTQYVEDSCDTSFDRTSLVKFLNGKHPASIAFIWACSQACGVSLDDLVSEQFNPANSNLEQCQDTTGLKTPKLDFELPENSQNIIFVEDPNSSILKNYIQDYYCYYYSTVSAENRVNDTKNAIIEGILSLKADGQKCKAVLRIDTKEYDENGDKIYKEYTGNVIVCPSIQSVHCIMYLPEGEFCFLIFRYSHLNNKKQLCRIAEVLSTSSAVDKRYPIVHRMLLSQKSIKHEHLNIIAPYLCLNYSDITIDAKELESLSNSSEQYRNIIDEVKREECVTMYRLREKRVYDAAKKNLSDEAELITFMTELRAHSLAYRYNKVSKTADNNIFKQLEQLGYYNVPDNH
ncbi:MAG: hypothetical protein K1W41_10400 [Lachnospiraceae bacterium]